MAKQDAESSWEEQALAALEAGERDQALSVLVAGCGRAILAYCRARLGDEASAADVAQDVFVALWQALPGFRRESSLRTWVFAIAHHRCARHQGLRQRLSRLFVAGSTSTVAAVQPDPAASPEAVTIQHHQAERLRRVLAQLKRKERDLLTMYYLEELSLDQIAARYSVSRETVRQQVLKAQQKCKQLMEDTPDATERTRPPRHPA